MTVNREGDPAIESLIESGIWQVRHLRFAPSSHILFCWGRFVIRTNTANDLAVVTLEGIVCAVIRDVVTRPVMMHTRFVSVELSNSLLKVFQKLGIGDDKLRFEHCKGVQDLCQVLLGLGSLASDDHGTCVPDATPLASAFFRAGFVENGLESSAGCFTRPHVCGYSFPCFIVFPLRVLCIFQQLFNRWQLFGNLLDPLWRVSLGGLRDFVGKLQEIN